MIYASPTAVIQPEQTVWLETIHKTCDVVFVDEGDSVQAQMDCSFAPAQVFETLLPVLQVGVRLATPMMCRFHQQW